MCVLQSLNLSFFILGIYFSVCLALMVISLLETVIITNVLHHSTMKYQEVPKWVRVVVLRHIANLICYRWQEEVQPPSIPQKDKRDSLNCSSDPQIVQPASQTPVQHPTSNGGNITDSLNGKYYFRLSIKTHKSKRNMNVCMSGKEICLT